MRPEPLAKPLNVLLVGSGGREHALAHKLQGSALCKQLHCAPGNDGIALTLRAKGGQCWPDGSFDAIKQGIEDRDIGLVVIGPEQPLADGLVDQLKAHFGGKLKVLGPSQAAAQLESSKSFMKLVAQNAAVPTAAFLSTNDQAEALAYLDDMSLPIVVKADGLAAGKGVIIAETLDDAQRAVKDCLSEGRFGTAGARLVIEEFMVGSEVSAFYLVQDGKARLIGAAQDHKRLEDGDTGPNTGGMGTFSPSPLFDAQLQQQVLSEIIEPSLKQMDAQGCRFEGFLFAGLMITDQGPKLLEYNVRMGDPETQSLMPLISSDLLAAILDPNQTIEVSSQAAVTVVLAAKGYPDRPEKGAEIPGLQAKLDRIANSSDQIITVAGARYDQQDWRATGGRVLGVTGVGPNLAVARTKAYELADKLAWQGAQFRSDICA